MGSEPVDRKPVIAFFSDASWTGGAEKYLHLLAAGIRSCGFEPALIMNRNPRLERLKQWMEEDRVPVHEVSLGLPFSLAGTGRFTGILRRIGPELLHINLPGPFDSQFSLVAPLARLAGVRRVVSTEHLPMCESFAKGRVLKSFSTRWIDRVITVSEDNRMHLVRNHGVPDGKIRVVRIGIPEPQTAPPAGIRSSLGIADDALVLVIAGALDGRKGHDTMFHALAKLPARLHLVVLGEGERGGEFRGTVKAAGIDERVHFMGHRDDVFAVLREADLLVHPSEIDATPYVIVEAMAAGLPVVASGIYGIPELVIDGETGVLVPPGDSAATAGTLRILAADPEMRVKMGAAARKRYEEHFRLSTSLSRTVAVYEEIMGGPSTGGEGR
jgi:glycosyltransferase involved in cell wall biosynthesis